MQPLAKLHNAAAQAAPDLWKPPAEEQEGYHQDNDHFDRADVWDKCEGWHGYSELGGLERSIEAMLAPRVNGSGDVFGMRMFTPMDSSSARNVGSETP
jgi:hypothetical protein